MHLKKWIKITAVNIHDNELLLNYVDYKDRVIDITVGFSIDIEIPLQQYSANQIEHALQYVSLTQAMYLFSFDYYEEIVAYYKPIEDERQIFEQLYLHGLAEFRYKNHLPLQSTVQISGQHPYTKHVDGRQPELSGALIMNGGGKDGIVASELAADTMRDLTWFTMDNRGVRQKVMDVSDITSQITCIRSFSYAPKHGQYRGHKATSADIASLAHIAAMASRKQYIVVGNEYSSNEGNFIHEGLEINHQYSKSHDFERSISRLFKNHGSGVTYFSILRPLYELQIIAMFCHFPKYHSVFVSCNASWSQGAWCMSCAKCAFVVLAVTASSPQLAETIWGNRLSLANIALRKHILDLISPDNQKPFECVGTLDECQLAVGMIKHNSEYWDTLPEDLQTQFLPFIPKDYDNLYARIMETVNRHHSIPQKLWPQVSSLYATYLSSTRSDSSI